MSKLRELIDKANGLWAPQERPFTSSVPVIGPAIVSMRRALTWMSAKWYVRPILEQQIAFNLTLVQAIQEIFTNLEQQGRTLSSQLRDMEGMIISIDRDQTSLAREVAGLRHRLSKLTGSDVSAGSSHHEKGSPEGAEGPGCRDGNVGEGCG